MEVQRRGEPLKQVAQSFGSSYDTFFRAYQAGHITCIRLGSRLIVPAAEIERLSREGLPSRSTKTVGKRRASVQARE